jgi:hypothetical protein
MDEKYFRRSVSFFISPAQYTIVSANSSRVVPNAATEQNISHEVADRTLFSAQRIRYFHPRALATLRQKLSFPKVRV